MDRWTNNEREARGFDSFAKACDCVVKYGNAKIVWSKIHRASVVLRHGHNGLEFIAE